MPNESYVLYSCSKPLLGPALHELVVATRAKAVDAAAVEAMLDRARSLGVPFDSADVKHVDRARCDEATAE